MGPTPPQTVVLITGANQGLGFECVKKLAAEQPNYHILLCSRDYSKGVAAAGSIAILSSNTTVEPLELDITSDTSIATAFKKIESTHGRLDVVFNNAAIAQAGRPSMREEWAALYNTNVVSAYAVSAAFIPLLKKSSLPRLLFMSSGMGSITETLDPTSLTYGLTVDAYSASKAAMNMIAAKFAVAYKDDGFKVNVIDPGFRATSMNGYSEFGGKAVDGATEACRIIVQGKDGQYSTFSRNEGEVPW